MVNADKISQRYIFSDKNVKTLALTLALADDKAKNDLVDICLPESLKKWKEKEKYKDEPGTKYEDKDHPCAVSVKDLDGKTTSGREKSMRQKVKNWDTFDKQLKKDKILRKYPKVCSKFSFFS